MRHVMFGAAHGVFGAAGGARQRACTAALVLLSACAGGTPLAADPLEVDDPAFSDVPHGAVVAAQGDAPGQEVPPIAWLEKLDLAKSQANREGRHIAIWVHADWMTPSAELPRTVWSELRIRRAFRPLVPVKLDLTNGGELSETVLGRYSLRQIPTLLLIDARERELGRVDAPITVERVLALISKAD